jgi:raffinose/stachyose/melibiose transport system permease protein
VHAATNPRTGSRSSRYEYTATIILFLLPMLIFLGIFIVWPILSSFSLSFYKWNGLTTTQQFVGLENWVTLLKDPVFWKAFSNNVLLVVLSIGIQLPIGMALAVLLDKGGRKLNIFKTVYFFPLMMSPIAVGILFKYIYDPTFGLVTSFLQAIHADGLVRNWLGDPSVALFSVIAVICWEFIPFYMLLFLAGMTAIPEELHEVALIDGATENQYFWKITLPLLRGTIRAAVILSLIGSLKYFDLIWVMTEGGPVRATELMTTYMVKESFQAYHMGYGSTIASAMFIIIMIIALGVLVITRRREAE